GAICAKDFGVGCPLTLAEVDTMGRPRPRIRDWQKESRQTRMARVLSSATRFLATFRGRSYIIVVGFVLASIRRTAFSGTSSTYSRSIFTSETKQIKALLSGLSFRA